MITHGGKKSSKSDNKHSEERDFSTMSDSEGSLLQYLSENESVACSVLNSHFEEEESISSEKQWLRVITDDSKRTTLESDNKIEIPDVKMMNNLTVRKADKRMPTSFTAENQEVMNCDGIPTSPAHKNDTFPLKLEISFPNETVVVNRNGVNADAFIDPHEADKEVLFSSSTVKQVMNSDEVSTSMTCETESFPLTVKKSFEGGTIVENYRKSRRFNTVAACFGLLTFATLLQYCFKCERRASRWRHELNVLKEQEKSWESEREKLSNQVLQLRNERDALKLDRKPGTENHDDGFIFSKNPFFNDGAKCAKNKSPRSYEYNGCYIKSSFELGECYENHEKQLMENFESTKEYIQTGVENTKEFIQTGVESTKEFIQTEVNSFTNYARNVYNDVVDDDYWSLSNVSDGIQNSFKKIYYYS